MHPQSAQFLIRTQIALEYALDAEDRLVPYPGSAEQARFIIHRHSDGFLRFYRHDLPAEVRRRLGALPAIAAYEHRERVREMLAGHAPCTAAFFGTSAVLRRHPDPSEFAQVVHTSEGFVVHVGAVVASIAWSARENATAAELALETAEGHRRCGYGRQVAAAWAHHVLAQGKVAFYSYAESNNASQALARSLGVVKFSRVAAYE